jgi:6,7-dimethyl-8-ribityllumazine synthase
MNARIAILKSSFNPEICDGLLAGAHSVLGEFSDIEATVITVPGAFELPLIAQSVAASGRCDAIIALGAVIEGDTAHFLHISQAAAQGLQRVSLESGLPIGFGVLTTYTLEQALVRSHPSSPDNKGREAAHAVLATLRILHDIEQTR